jgi:hypothetical protein
MDKSPSDGLQKYRLKRKSPNFSRKKNHLQYKKVYTIFIACKQRRKMRRGVGERKKAKILIPLTWNQDGL